MSSGGGLDSLIEIIDILAEYGQLVIEQRSGCRALRSRHPEVVEDRGGRPSVDDSVSNNHVGSQENGTS